jgi:hypothetical protein
VFALAWLMLLRVIYLDWWCVLALVAWSVIALVAGVILGRYAPKAEVNNGS